MDIGSIVIWETKIPWVLQHGQKKKKKFLITPAKSLLPYEVTDWQVPGIRIWTFCGGWGSICYSAYHRVKKASLRKEYLTWKLSTSQKWEEKEQLSQQSKQQGQRPWGESFWSPSTGDKPRRGEYRMQTRWRGSGRQAPWAVMRTLGFIPVLSGATGKPEPVTDMTWLVSEGTMVRVLLTRWRKPSVLWGAEFGCSVVVWMGRDPGPN